MYPFAGRVQERPQSPPATLAALVADSTPLHPLERRGSRFAAPGPGPQQSGYWPAHHTRFVSSQAMADILGPNATRNIPGSEGLLSIDSMGRILPSPIGPVRHQTNTALHLNPMSPSFLPAPVRSDNQISRLNTFNMPVANNNMIQPISYEKSRGTTDVSRNSLHFGQPGPSSAVVKSTRIPESVDDDDFAPTTMALYGEGIQREPTALEKAMQVATNMSPNYRGDPGNIHNYSNEGLSDHENCSFWLEGLPPDVDYHEVLSQIQGCGKVYACRVNKEKVAQLGHAACKLVFTGQAGAQRFWALYGQTRRLSVRGYFPSIRHNRIKVAEQSGLVNGNHSRCLRISGPQEIVNPDNLFSFWEKKFKGDIETVIHHPNCIPGHATIEIRFGSYRAQAAIAFKILTKCSVFRDNGVRVEYAHDPCDI